MFHLTVVDFFREFYQLKLNSCIYKAYVATVWGPVTLKGLAGLMNRNWQSCEKFENFVGKVRKILRHGF